ncbi:MAG TPA: hypothetical protein VNQ48_00200 [Microbacteriaceae bacterium]|nr:hypothetical protein [Microbacteriaceae bacterium]
MAGAGRISLLVDSPLRTLILALRGLDKETRTQIGRATKASALEIWENELLTSIAADRKEARLASSGRVSVTTRNVTLLAGAKGALSSGTPLAAVATAIEFGMGADKPIQRTSTKGKKYTYRSGARFRRRQPNGYVVFPAARRAIPRITALWIRTAYRTLHEQIEEAARGQ